MESITRQPVEGPSDLTDVTTTTKRNTKLGGLLHKHFAPKLQDQPSHKFGDIVEKIRQSQLEQKKKLRERHGALKQMALQFIEGDRSKATERSIQRDVLERMTKIEGNISKKISRPWGATKLLKETQPHVNKTEAKTSSPAVLTVEQPIANDVPHKANTDETQNRENESIRKQKELSALRKEKKQSNTRIRIGAISGISTHATTNRADSLLHRIGVNECAPQSSALKSFLEAQTERASTGQTNWSDYNIAVAEHAAGNFSRAIVHYRRALLQQPDSIFVLYNLSVLIDLCACLRLQRQRKEQYSSDSTLRQSNRSLQTQCPQGYLSSSCGLPSFANGAMTQTVREYHDALLWELEQQPVSSTVECRNRIASTKLSFENDIRHDHVLNDAFRERHALLENIITLLNDDLRNTGHDIFSLKVDGTDTLDLHKIRSSIPVERIVIYRDALFDLAVLFQQKCEISKAKRFFELCLIMDPSCKDASAALGVLLYSSGIKSFSEGTRGIGNPQKLEQSALQISEATTRIGGTAEGKKNTHDIAIIRPAVTESIAFALPT